MKSISLVVTVALVFLLAGSTLVLGQDAGAIEAKGIEQCNNGQFDQAIATFTQGLKQKPNDATMHYLRGRAYTAKGQYGPAMEDLDNAIKQNPNYGQAYFARAMIHVYRENYDEALEDLTKAERNGYKDADFLKLVQKKAGMKKGK